LTKAVFLGRFQPFHDGHNGVVEKYSEEFDEFVIVVGSAGKSGERDNPLSFEQRKKVIQNCYPDIEVLPLEDHESDEIWLQDLKELTDADVVISQNDYVKQLIKESEMFELVEQKLESPKIYSGTEVRRRIRSGEEWRYLLPKCAADQMDEFVDSVKDAGIQYEFKPGWERENAYHDTYEK
jgi:nicotinamide-nucleotide adenylyltransferase